MPDRPDLSIYLHHGLFVSRLQGSLYNLQGQFDGHLHTLHVSE